MNKQSILHILWLVTFVLLMVNAAIGFFGGYLPVRYWQNKRVGKPIIETVDRFFIGDVTTIATDGTYIYCCFGSRHMAKVFDLNGQHVATIAISDTNSGGGKMILREMDGKVMFDADGDCYYFISGEFVSFEQKLPVRDRGKRETVDSLGNIYFIQKGSVLKQAPDGTVSYFYQVPAFARISSFGISWQIHACLITLGAVFYGLRNRLN